MNGSRYIIESEAYDYPEADYPEADYPEADYPEADYPEADYPEAADSRRGPYPYNRGRYSPYRRPQTLRQPLRPIRPSGFEGANKVTLDTPRGPLTADLKETVVPKEVFSQEIQKVDNAINRIADRNNALQNDLQNNVGSLRNDVRRSNVQERNAFDKLREEQRASENIKALISFIGQKSILEEVGTKNANGEFDSKTQKAITTSALISGAIIATNMFAPRDLYSHSKGSNFITKNLGGNNGPLITLLVLFALFKFDIITDISKLFGPNTSSTTTTT